MGVLKDCEVEDSAPIWKKNLSKKKKTNEDRSKERKESIETAFSGVQENGKCRISELAEYIGKSEKTVDRKKSKSVRTKSNFFSCRTISKITEFVGRTDKSIIINNTFCRGLETAPTKK